MGRRLAYDDVVALIYDAAAQPTRWPAALEVLGNYCGGTGSHLFLWDRRHDACLFTVVGGIPTEPQEPYARYYGAIDPRVPLLDRMPVGTVLNDVEHFDAAFVERSEFYQDFYIPAGFRWVLASEIRRDGGLRGFLGVLRERRREAYGPAEAARCRRVLPHLRRAVEIHRVLGHLDAERGAMAAALHELATGVAFVGADLRMLWANCEAEAILRAADGLAVRGGRLRAALDADAGRLRRLIERAAAGTGGSGGEMLVTRPSGARPYVLLAAPCPAWGPEERDPTALLLVTDPESQPVGLAATARQLFGLTRAEARVAEEVWQGKRLEEIAEERSVSLATVRSQLHAVLAKTDTTRQSELVRLLASLPTRSGSPAAPGNSPPGLQPTPAPAAPTPKLPAAGLHSHSIVPGGLEVTS